ncbi:hypothetical protein BKI52_34445 [marine bacterium AO1-C]|nr:hypothetical protein BKI52_34445 [marine bacterium AO1-C]
MKKILIISTDRQKGGSITTFNHIAQQLNLTVLGIAEDFATISAYIQKTIPDLIICDVSLNDDYDGLEILRQISTKYPIASILVSSWPNTSYPDETQGIQVVGYLTKPFVPNQVKITIKVSLGSLV